MESASSLAEILRNLSSPAAIIGGVIFVVFMVKSIFNYTTHRSKCSSPASIVIEAMVILVCIGLIFYVTSNFETVRQSFTQIAGVGVDTVSDVITDMVAPEATEEVKHASYSQL